MSLRFHWRLAAHSKKSADINADSQEFGLPDIEADIRFCHSAEENGIESLLTPFNNYKPDPILLSTALGIATQKITLMVAYRPGLLSPTLFVQQINTLSALTNGRVSLNIIAGHSKKEQGYYGDFLNHDERYARAGEFLEVCHGLWQSNRGFSFKGEYFQVEEAQLGTPFVSAERTFPEIYIGGGSPPAQELAIKQGCCWLLLFDTPKNLQPRTQSVLKQGVDVGLRGSIVVRPTRQEAIEAAYALIDVTKKQWIEDVFAKSSEFESIKAAFEHVQEADANWLTPWLWKGAVPFCGPSSIALVGTPTDVASAIIEYKSIGCSQFILSGQPDLETMTYFCQEVLPIIREMEQKIKY
ncbi:MAG: LLM class flavin-dependent oxidoreductase [Cyanobacteria bacterium P01_B01_bin.77]